MEKGEGRREEKTHTDTHTHLVTPVRQELVQVVLRIVPATKGEGREGKKSKIQNPIVIIYHKINHIISNINIHLEPTYRNAGSAVNVGGTSKHK